MPADIGKTIFCDGKPFFPQGTFVPDKKHTCCFTGHRPDKMPAGDKLDELRMSVKTAAEVLINRGYDTFITGMAPGFDLLATEILLHESEFRQVRLICALPYRYRHIEQAAGSGQSGVYLEALEKCKAAAYFFENYDSRCYKVRNQFMVNCSSFVIAYLKDPSALKTGTAMTLNMAERNGVQKLVIYGNRL